MDCYWLFTWRSYGSWLPGQDGFVGYYPDFIRTKNPTGQVLLPSGRALITNPATHVAGSSKQRIIENVLGTPTARPQPGLEAYARIIMPADATVLSYEHAHALLPQFHETAAHRGWAIDAVAVLSTHVHLVFGVPGNPDPSDLLRDWKAYASRALNRKFGKKLKGRWFADRASKRRLKTPLRRQAAIAYVRDQDNPLLVWLSDEAKRILSEPAT